MTCGLFDISCQLAPVLFWIKVTVGVIVAVFLLGGLAWVYRTFGWWGVAVALTVGGAAVVFKKGVDFGRYISPPPPKVKKVPDPTKPIAPGIDNIIKRWMNPSGKYHD